MKFKRILAMLLLVLMVVPSFNMWSFAADRETGEVTADTTAASTIASKLNGETSRTSRTLYNGVTRTTIKTSSSSKYEVESFNIVEFDPAQSDLYVDVTNTQTYANQTKSTLNTVTSFNSSNGQGKTAIAAINGDLWMTSYAHSRVEGSGTSYGGYSDAVVTKALTLPRGFNVYNGEIVCSAYMQQETPFEGEFWSFGMTNDSVPMIGCPELDISITNNSRGSTIAADGLNRLPANNALVVYSDKGCLNNYALSDAYEVVIDVSSDYTVKHGASITGTVTGIYSSSTSTNPTMQANRIILTARGTKTLLLNNFAVGNSVTLNFSVTERYGRNTAGWQNVYCAVGGHMPFVVDGAKWETGTTTNYPSTIVGIKNDGKVVFITDDLGTTGSRGGMDFNDYWDFADDMDLNTAFILDGGGSTTMVELGSSGSYSVINNPTDGSARSVVNSVILSAGPKKTNIGKYDLKFPDDTIDLTNLYFATDDAFMLLTNFAESKIEKTATGAKIKVEDFLNGPTVSISYGLPNGTSANANSALSGEYHYNIPTSDYPYLVLDMSLVTADASIVQFQALYHTSGSRKGVSTTTFIGFNNANNNTGFGKYIINPASNTAYTGTLNTFRLQYLFPANGVTVKNGDYVILRSARLASTLDEANTLAAASAPSMQTVTFNANGGTNTQAKKYAVRNSYYGSMPTPVRAGYTFDGWYTAASGGTKITSDSVVTNVSSRTLYAHWSTDSSTPDTGSYTVTFDPNGGTLSGSASYGISVGQTYSSAIGSMPSATKEGYTLTGWYNEKYGYTLNMNDTFSVNENVTFKAVWTLNAGDYPTGTYSTTASWLTLRAGPGTSYSSLGSVAQGTVVEITQVSGRWGNCIYNGQSVWLSLAYAELIEETETVYTLTFNVNGGTMPSGYSTTYEFLADEKFVDVIGGFPVPTKSGYEFAGWKNTLAGTSDIWDDGWGSQPYTFGADITLKAQWTAHTHSYTSSVTKAATCTEAGVRTYKCSCGNSYTEAIAALGHKYTTTTTDATCTAAGKTVKTCSRCGDTVTTTLPALGHDYKSVTKEPTCTSEGVITYTCQRCGNSYTESIPMADHSFGAWVETKAPTTTEVGIETRTCTVCGATETQEIPMLSADAPLIAGVDNYTITLNGINNIKEIRFAIGHYTTGSEVKAAEKNVTMDAATVAKYTADGVMTYNLPWMGEYTFWVRLNDGSSYFLYTEINDITPYVESYGVKMTVKDYAENYKDMWLAEGTFNSYSEIKASTGFKYQASANKLDLYAKTTHDFSYTMTNPGPYTVLIRYNDGTADVIHHTLTVDYPEFKENGLQVTVTNIPDIKIIRTAYGHYESVSEIKAATGVRNFSNKNDIKNAESYMIQYRDEGEVTLIVEYNNGYKHFYYYNVEQKVPTYTLEGDTITFGDLDDLYIIRYAPGKYTTANNIKNAPGSQYKKADSIDANGEIVIDGLTAGRWSFMVQYNDESYNFYVLDIE
ncbi:MAG: InlB B-repeat-containing protein [Clostridia bacterium]|nr:InlB B-repeat-containing protein [Clostridia bacterium]